MAFSAQRKRTFNSHDLRRKKDHKELNAGLGLNRSVHTASLNTTRSYIELCKNLKPTLFSFVGERKWCKPE
ncbi:hypothetical protein RvY_08816 [Ramazzottius varieornatus]|uniref:Uncharacterized protein n=1 Tax=Ramazzottius varieornatus TaxID=947166 RepID=A0A1D1V767_RAMVA|nr:hypothetical protein RvY_08816 [Ramazzottius varieornatus]